MAETTTPETVLGRSRAPLSARWRPSLRYRAAAGLLALAMLAGGPTGARAADAEVTATVANGFARLLFTLPEGVTPEVRLAQGIVIIAFDRPLDISVERLPGSAPGYIGVSRRDPDGMAVRIALSRRVTVNTMAAGEKFFVDLLPEGWTGLPPGLPQSVVDELSRRARDAERRARDRQQPGQRANERTIRVRVASLPTFTRYVFELSEMIAVATDRNREKFSLSFDAPLKFDLADAKAASPEWVASLDAETRADDATVHFVFAEKVDVRSFREDAAFVVDVSRMGARERGAGTGDQGEAGERPPPRQSGAPASPPSDRAQPAPAPSVVPATPVPVTVPATPAPTQPQTPPAQRQAETPPPAAPASPPAEPEPRQADAAPPPAQPSAPPADPNAPVIAQAQRQNGHIRLVFPFREPTAAAVFQRADSLWLVFDTALPIDLARLSEESAGAVRAATSTPSAGGQALQIRLDRARLASVGTEERAWVVTLAGTVVEPSVPLTIKRTRGPQGGSLALIPFASPQRLHRLEDPVAGGTLLVVTGHAPGRGLHKAQEFVDFRALATTHGIAIEPIADDVEVELAAERVVIGRPGGLELTAETEGASQSRVPGYRRAALDPQSWGFDRQAEYADRHVALTHALAAAPEGKQTAARLDFARFYLARDMAPEAKGALDVLLAGERDSEQLAIGLVLRAIANILLRREDLALKDLASPLVGDQHHAPLWRGLALSRHGRFADARNAFKNVGVAAAELPSELQRVVYQEAARCALEVGDLEEASRRLNELEAIGVPYELRAATSLLAGRLAEALNRADDALAAYRAAAESSDEPAAAQARLRMLTLRHALKQVDEPGAIEELERLTASWRGDETELESLQRLAKLYAEESRFRDAFNLLRVAMSAHPRAQITRRIQDDAATTFDSLFLGERGNALSPIDALALFYDFRTLTPTGRRGDEMIRRLAERLVGMDLLEQASALLQHQIDHRLQGAPRSQVAARAAMIYLMNRKPDRALRVLRTTRMNELPSDLRAQRLLLEARALSDSGRHDLAIEIIEGMQGTDVARLRADIHWAARHWREAAEEIERLYGRRHSEDAPLDETERADVLRAAVGYALAEDIIGLERFREKYAAKMAQTPEARLFAVITAPLSNRSPEFKEIARASMSVDTLDAFLRDLRARYPENPPAAAAPAPAGNG